MVKGAASSQEEITLMEFKHPKYYKELRKRNRSFLLRKEECTLGKLGNSRLEETSSDKHQASSLGGPPSIKPQASSWVGPPIIKPPTSRKKFK